jgi:uncharacterized iron-regulated membrane protein
MRWAALYRRPPILRGVSASQIRADHCVNFDQHPWVDRFVGTGVAAHEGHLFGWLNQLVSLFTAMGLILICISAIILW